jgi:hypothetical protein
MILIAFRHGLRAAEVCDLRWDQVDFDAAVLHVRRVKNGTPSTHPLRGDEMRALRRLQRESDKSPFVFVSERGSPFTTAGFARIVERTGAAGLELKAHPHMLREACGYALANIGYDTRAIQVWLGIGFAGVGGSTTTSLLQQLRRRGGVHRHPPGLVSGEHLGLAGGLFVVPRPGGLDRLAQSSADRPRRFGGHSSPRIGKSTVRACCERRARLARRRAVEPLRRGAQAVGHL